MMTTVACSLDFPLTSTDAEFLQPPPRWFKQCKLVKVEGDTIFLHCRRTATCFTEDGCKVNVRACELLSQNLGFKSPYLRCQAHAADGSIKRLAKSKTMCVDIVVDTAKELKSIIKHFQNSPLHTEYLREAMRMMGMKPLFILNWASTRMCGLLTACERITRILVPFIDTVTQLNIKEETAQKLLTPMHLNCLLILGELQHVFCPKYLRPLDKSDIIISEVFHIVQSSLQEIRSFRSTLSEDFVKNLEFDQYGNLWAHISLKNAAAESNHCDHLNAPEIIEDNGDSDTSTYTDSESEESEDSDIELESDIRPLNKASHKKVNQPVVNSDRLMKKPTGHTTEGFSNHTVMLRYSHKPKRNITKEELADLKMELLDLTKTIRDNLIKNIEDQNPPDSLVGWWSCLDLDSSEDIDSRKEKIKRIF